MINLKKMIVLILLNVSILSLAVNASAVFVSPAENIFYTDTSNVGNPVAYMVNITNASYLYGFEFQLSYNPTLLNNTQVFPGTLSDAANTSSSVYIYLIGGQSHGTPNNKGDINNDGIVDVYDGVIISAAFGSSCDLDTCSVGNDCWSNFTECVHSPEWNPKADIYYNETIEGNHTIIGLKDMVTFLIDHQARSNITLGTVKYLELLVGPQDGAFGDFTLARIRSSIAYEPPYGNAMSDLDLHDVKFTDINGTSLSHYETDGIYKFLDRIAPNITIYSPMNKTLETNSVPLTVGTNEPTSWIGYSLDDQPNTTFASNMPIGYSSIMLSGLTGGLHSIRVFANDTNGNMGVSKTVYFTIPYFKVIAPVNGMTYSANYFWLINEVYIPYTATSYSIDGGNWTLFSGNPKIYSTYGAHNIKMKVETETNTYYSDLINFSLKNAGGGCSSCRRM